MYTNHIIIKIKEKKHTVIIQCEFRHERHWMDKKKKPAAALPLVKTAPGTLPDTRLVRVKTSAPRALRIIAFNQQSNIFFFFLTIRTHYAPVYYAQTTPANIAMVMQYVCVCVCVHRHRRHYTLYASAADLLAPRRRFVPLRRRRRPADNASPSPPLSRPFAIAINPRRLDI